MVAALLSLGVVAIAGSTPVLSAVGLFLAAGAFGGLARAAVVSVVSRDPLAARGD